MLEFLLLPLAIDWKIAGDPDVNYQPVARVDKLADVQSVNGLVNWEFRSGSIYLTPSSGVIDIRVRFFGMPATSLSTTSSTVTRAITNIFVYKVAAKIASRNGQEQLAADIGQDYARALENLEELLTKQDQQVRRKFGRMNQRGYGNNFKIPTATS